MNELSASAVARDPRDAEYKEGFFRDIVEHNPDLILCVAPDGVIHYANPAFWGLVKRDSGRGANFMKSLSIESRGIFLAAAEELSRGGDTERVELLLWDTHKQAHPVEAHINAHFDGETVTWFRVVLRMQPVIEGAAAPVDETPRILVVEDDPVSARMLSRMLENGGFETEWAATAAAAIEMLSEDYYDAMTLDLMLPDRNGLDLLREIRADAETEEMPVIVVSASADKTRDSLSGDAAYVVDWLNKPFDPGALQSAMAGAIRNDKERLPRVLHVEADDAFFEQVSQTLLGSAGIDRARTLGEARKMLQDNDDYDLVLLGLNLPDGFGAELLPFLNRPRGRSVPVILVSSDEAVDALSSHVADTLNKSHATQQQMLETIRAHLRPSPPAH
ncbi:response regulator [Bradymonas sediminis]|uniref:response regulator n=1 Tax=Bradymonas sediminis TaxID=1548548 RepID=UPI0013A6A17E|nr:response regulator [Bradymonas sediminis]